MSGNAIIKSIFDGKIFKFGVEIICEVATETTGWWRSSDLAKTYGLALKEAVENSTVPLPPSTRKVICRCVIPKYTLTPFHGLILKLTSGKALTTGLGI